MSKDEEVLDQDANDQEVEETEETEETTEEAEKESAEESEESKESETEESDESEDGDKSPEKAEDPEKSQKKEQKKPNRPAWTMPVAKAQEEKRAAVEKALAEAERAKQEEIARIKAEYEAKKPLSADEWAEIDKVAETHGLDREAARELYSTFEKRIKSVLPDTSKYDDLIKQQEIEAHKAKVTQEFDSVVLPLIQKDYPSVTPQHIAEVREKISELAFSEGYNTYRLEDIYKVKRDEFEFKNGYTAETSGGRSSELVDFSKVSDKEELEMAKNDPDTFKKFVEWQRSRDSRFLD